MFHRKSLALAKIDAWVGARASHRWSAHQLQTNGAIPFLIRISLIPAIAFLLGGAISGADAREVVFTSPEKPQSVNTEGVVTLAWVADGEAEGLEYELQQSEDANFTGAVTRYQGPDMGSVLTGFQEREYHFRVREIGPAAEWSAPVSVKITYMEKSRVILLLWLGGFVFVATVGTLLVGHFRKTA